MPRFGPTHRKILATLSLAAAALPPSLAAADESDEACYPPSTSIGWSQPKAVPISADGAVRWPLDATMRVAYGGDWCPDDVRVTVERKDDGTGIPAEVRIRTPLATFKNEPFPLSLIDIDPIPTLEPSTDYVMTLRPENPALALFEEYVIEFRTSRREMDPLAGSDFAAAACLLAVRPPLATKSRSNNWRSISSQPTPRIASISAMVSAWGTGPS